MAATITTRFYETQDEASPGSPETGEWHDLSKIVYTSPNIDSPVAANTRSHVLPYLQQPALWYEEASYMYRIEDTQALTNESYDGATTSGLAFSMANSIVFEVTFGSAYQCRLTAWDDVTHSSTTGVVLSNEYCRASSVAYRYTGSDFTSPDTTTEVYAPKYNGWLKGYTTVSGQDAYYGDFDLNYQSDTSIHGDFLIFKPMLIGLGAGTPYGDHNFVIVLHYQYT